MTNAPATIPAFIPAVRQAVAIEQLPHGGFVVIAVQTPTTAPRALFASDDAESAADFVVGYYAGEFDAPASVPSSPASRFHDFAVHFDTKVIPLNNARAAFLPL